MRELTDWENQVIIEALHQLWLKQSKDGAEQNPSSNATAELLNLFATELDERQLWTFTMAQAKQYEERCVDERKKMSFEEVMKRVASKKSIDERNQQR